MSIIRKFGLICLLVIFASLSALSQSALAQTAETEPPQTTVQTIEQPIDSTPSSPNTPSTSGDLSSIDFDDPDIVAAIEAKEEAERAFTDAVKKQMELNAEEAAKAEGKSSPKPSIIPKNADEAKALLGKIGDKILGWVTSIKFLAQVGAIVAAYILSPMIAALLRKRIFLFKDKPAEDVKLKNSHLTHSIWRYIKSRPSCG